MPEALLAKMRTEGVIGVLMKGASALLSFAAAILLARWLGTEGFGFYSVCLGVATVIASVTQMGAGDLAVRLSASLQARGRTEEIIPLRNTLDRWIVAVGGLAVAGLMIGVWFLTGTPYQVWDLAPWALAGAVVIPVGLTVIRSGILKGVGEFTKGILPGAIVMPAFVALGASFLMIFTHSWEFSSPVIALGLYASASIATWFVSDRLLTRRFRSHPPGPTPSRESLREYFREGVPFGVADASHVMHTYTALLVIGATLGETEAGIFKVAMQASILVVFFSSSINAMLSPHFTRLNIVNDRQTMAAAAGTSSRVLTIGGLGSFVALLLWGEPFIGLSFGIEFEPAFLPLLILAAGHVVNVATGPAADLLNMTGYGRITAGTKVTATIVNVPLTLLLSFHWGLAGAAAASALTLAFWNLGLVWAVRSRLGVNCTAFYSRKRCAGVGT